MDPPRKPAAAIVNPRSASGQTGRRWQETQAKLAEAFPQIQIMQTASIGHAIELAAGAVRSGYGTIIAVGGDGTLNETVNGILSAGAPNPDVQLGLIPRGTGSDFRRTVALPLDDDNAVKIIARGKTARFDAMRVVYQDLDGVNRVRYALNVTSFGMGGAVAERVNRSSKPFGGKAAFLMATAVTGFNFACPGVSIQADNGASRQVRITNVAIGNGQYHGAGMHVCPRAVLDDGLLDVTVIERLSLWEIARNIPILFNGRLYDHPKIHHSRVKKLVANSQEAAKIEIDGEPLGHLPLEVTVLPGAICMFVP